MKKKSVTSKPAYFVSTHPLTLKSHGHSGNLPCISLENAEGYHTQDS